MLNIKAKQGHSGGFLDPHMAFCSYPHRSTSQVGYHTTWRPSMLGIEVYGLSALKRDFVHITTSNEQALARISAGKSEVER